MVLVVDDEAAIRYLCRVNLELDGFDIVEAGTLAEARERLGEYAVAVVLLDMHVAGERGDDLLDELLDREPPPAVAIVTGSVDLEHAGDGRADAVLAKPFTIDELTTTVRSLAARALEPR